MSEESTTPSLRLKPRLKPDAAATAADPAGDNKAATTSTGAVSTSATNGASAGEPGALKLRPRASADTAAAPIAPIPLPPSQPTAAAAAPAHGEAPAPAPTSHVVPPTPPAPPVPEPAAATPSSADSVDAGRLKLKPRVAAETDPTLPPVAPVLPLPPTPTIPQVRTNPPIPTLPPIGANPPVLPPGLPPPARGAHSPVPPGITIKPPSVMGKRSERPEQSSAFKAGIWVLVSVLVVAVLGVGLLAYRFLSKPKPEPAPQTVAAQPTPPPAKVPEPAVQTPAAPAPTAPTVVQNPQSMPGKMVAKAQSVVAAREASGQVKGVDEVMDDPANAHGTPAPKSPATTARPRAATTPPAATTAATPTETEPATALETPPEAPAVRPQPTTAFRAFVINMRVNGVFQGQPGRAFINGRMYHVGEVVDTKLGIRFSRIDSDDKTLFFEDKTTAEMSRRY